MEGVRCVEGVCVSNLLVSLALCTKEQSAFVSWVKSMFFVATSGVAVVAMRKDGDAHVWNVLPEASDHFPKSVSNLLQARVHGAGGVEGEHHLLNDVSTGHGLTKTMHSPCWKSRQGHSSLNEVFCIRS